MTRRVVRKVAYGAAHGSFAQAAAELAELAGLTVSPAEVARVAEQEGARLDRLQRQAEQRLRAPVSPERPAAPPEIRPERLVLEADATCVLTVAGQEHKSVYCGRAFDAGQRARKQDGGRPFLHESRYTASAVDMEDFGDRLKALAWRSGLRGAAAVAFVADGAPCLWKWARENLPEATVLIQDFWHVCEHLAGLSAVLWGEGEQTRRTLDRWKKALRESRLEEILSDLRTEHKRRRGATRRRIEQEIGYLENGRERMDYARFEREGWPIGSGAVEGTCKHLIKERFDKTGARWKRENIPYVLALRLALFNQQWEEAWNPN